MIRKYLSAHRYLIPVIHILFWVLLFLLLDMRWIESPRSGGTFPYRLLISSAFLVGFFYLNACYLFPAFYKRKGWVVYAILIVLAIFFLMQSSEFINNEFFPRRHPWRGHRPGFFIFSLLPYIFILGISTSYRIVSDYSREEKLRKEKEHETLKTELAFLRSQVSPHFMFNVLNSLVSLARKKSDLMEPSLIQLSSLMRYMLYESNDARIGLEQEVKYLKSYIDLQLLRFGDDLDVEWHLPDECGKYQIEPMLLISLVENAFKHGVGMVEEPFIKVNMEVDHGKDLLTFRVENSVPLVESAKDRSPGIGLHNMRRRLELLYKGRYNLEISQKANIFVSTLTISLT